MVNLTPLLFENFDKDPNTVKLNNNGHTVVYTINSDYKTTIVGGPLIGKYEFSQLHFHWGAHDWEGSENMINNNSFPMELHMVFFSSSYGSFEKATDHPDGLTVLSFLYSSSDEENEDYTPLIQGLLNVEDMNTSTVIKEPLAFDDLLVTNRTVYFTYGGSLTTPPCSEIVTWIEFNQTIPLGHNQIEVFRNLNGQNGKLSRNFRPTQPRYGRIIRMNRAIDPKNIAPTARQQKYLSFFTIICLISLQ